MTFEKFVYGDVHDLLDHLCYPPSFLHHTLDRKFCKLQQDGVTGLEWTVMGHGGGTQTSLLLMVANRPDKFAVNNPGSLKLDFAMFCNVGDRGQWSEWPETLEYMAYLYRYSNTPLLLLSPSQWYSVLETRGYQDDSGYRPSGLYDMYYQAESIAMRKFRSCTGDYKVKPQMNYLRACRSLAKFYGIDLSFKLVMGFSADEKKRADKFSTGYDWIKGEFPLVEWGMNRGDVIEFFKSQFPEIVSDIGLPKKSGCWFCPFQKRGKYDPITLEPTPRSWLALKHQHPDLLAMAVDMELVQNERRTVEGRKPAYIYGGKSIEYWVRPQNVQAGFNFGDEGEESGDDTCVSGHCFY